MSFADYIKIFELKPRYLFAVWFFGALLLLLPSYITDRFGFTAITNSYRGWIGLATLAVFTLWIVQMWSWYEERKEKGKVKSEAEAKAQAEARQQEEQLAQAHVEALRSLSTLSAGEQRLIMYALYNNQQTVVTRFTDQAAQALRSKRLLVAAGQGDAFNFPFTIPNFVWDHLQKHKAEFLPQEVIPAFERWMEMFEHSPDWQRTFAE